MMEELGEVIEGQRFRRRAIRGLGAIILGTYLIGGTLQGIHEYREHAGNIAQAEAHARENFCSEDRSNTLSSALTYVTWPGRQIGYWIAQHE